MIRSAKWWKQPSGKRWSRAVLISSSASSHHHGYCQRCTPAGRICDDRMALKPGARPPRRRTGGGTSRGVQAPGIAHQPRPPHGGCATTTAWAMQQRIWPLPRTGHVCRAGSPLPPGRAVARAYPPALTAVLAYRSWRSRHRREVEVTRRAKMQDRRGRRLVAGAKLALECSRSHSRVLQSRVAEVTDHHRGTTRPGKRLWWREDGDVIDVRSARPGPAGAVPRRRSLQCFVRRVGSRTEFRGRAIHPELTKGMSRKQFADPPIRSAVCGQPRTAIPYRAELAAAYRMVGLQPPVSRRAARHLAATIGGRRKPGPHASPAEKLALRRNESVSICVMRPCQTPTRRAGGRGRPGTQPAVDAVLAGCRSDSGHVTTGRNHQKSSPLTGRWLFSVARRPPGGPGNASPPLPDSHRERFFTGDIASP